MKRMAERRARWSRGSPDLSGDKDLSLFAAAQQPQQSVGQTLHRLRIGYRQFEVAFAGFPVGGESNAVRACIDA